MDERISHKVTDDQHLVIELMTNRFTHDLVSDLKNRYPVNVLKDYKRIEFNIRQVHMIDSSSIGFLFDLHNKLKAIDSDIELIVSVDDNAELKELLHKFQVDMLLNVK